MEIVTKPAQICVNGEAVAIELHSSLAALIERRKPRPPFAVELNKKLVRRGTYESVMLNEGDQVEIVTLVGGG